MKATKDTAHLGRGAVIYARVSSKEQEREGFSIPAQSKLLHRYAEESRVSVIKEFLDVETAKRSGRSGFGEMVSFFQQTPECRLLLVEKTDRLYRNLKDWVVLDELDLEIHFVKEAVVLSRDSQSSEKFLHGIKVLMAKNYVDNLSEEVRKGMREKAEQGHWPSVAPIGYRNNLETRRIEVDAERGPLVAKLFEWYASGELSLKALTAKAHSAGLSHPRSGRRLTKSEVHRALHNPIYHSGFVWKGKQYRGLHEPLISKGFLTPRRQSSVRATDLDTRSINMRSPVYLHVASVDVPSRPNSRRGVMSITTARVPEAGAEIPTSERKTLLDSSLSLFVVSRLVPKRPICSPKPFVRATTTRQHDKERLHRTAIMKSQQRHLSIQAKLDRAYDDRLAGKISEELWMRTLYSPLVAGVGRSRVSRPARSSNTPHPGRRPLPAAAPPASHNYSATGSKILELCQSAYSLYSQQKPVEQRRLLKILLSNCTFDRGTLTPTYNKPFDLLAEGNKTGNWLGGRDSNPDYTVQSRVSYH